MVLTQQTTFLFYANGNVTRLSGNRFFVVSLQKIFQLEIYELSHNKTLSDEMNKLLVQYLQPKKTIFRCVSAQFNLFVNNDTFELARGIFWGLKTNGGDRCI